MDFACMPLPKADAQRKTDKVSNQDFDLLQMAIAANPLAGVKITSEIDDLRRFVMPPTSSPIFPAIEARYFLLRDRLGLLFGSVIFHCGQYDTNFSLTPENVQEWELLISQAQLLVQ